MWWAAHRSSWTKRSPRTRSPREPSCRPGYIGRDDYKDNEASQIRIPARFTAVAFAGKGLCERLGPLQQTLAVIPFDKVWDDKIIQYAANFAVGQHTFKAVAHLDLDLPIFYRQQNQQTAVFRAADSPLIKQLGSILLGSLRLSCATVTTATLP